MSKKKNKLFLLSLLVTFLIFSTAIIVGIFPISANALSADRFEYSGVKYSVATTAPKTPVFSDTRKGLLLYTYESGATAELKGGYSGIFDAEVKASSNGAISPELTEYSFVFTNLINSEKFSLCIKDNGNETNACVMIDGDKTGIAYNVESSWNTQPRGYTSFLNEAGIYTRTLTSGTTSIRFNPTNMEVSIKNVSGVYDVIWNLSQSIVDGKQYNHILKEMQVYSVAIEFNSVKVGGKGQLTVYSINGEDYGSVRLSESQPYLFVSLNENAIVGKNYNLPLPSVFYFNDKVTSADVKYKIFNEKGDSVASGIFGNGASYIPSESGNYYLYYYVGEEVLSERYTVFKAYSETNVSCVFNGNDLESKSVGLNEKVYCKEVSVESNVYAQGYSKNAKLHIFKDGSVLHDFDGVSGGIYYKFTETGTYVIKYKTDICGVEFESEPVTITVSNDILGIDMAETNEKYAYGASFTAPSAKTYYDGEESETVVSIIIPDGSVIDGNTCELNQIGDYTIKYEYSFTKKSGYFTRDFAVEYYADDLFSTNEKSSVKFDSTAGNADMPGIIVTFAANSGKVTYDVDLSDNTKNDNLLEMIIIPQTLGIHDLTGFYVTLTDKLDRSNYVTIRICEGTGNAVSSSFVRARANNQAAYVGLYKDPDWDAGSPYAYTESVEDTMAHNAGGYLAPLNFGLDTFGNDIAKQTLCLQWDTEEVALYCNSPYLFQSDSTQRERLVADFNDMSCFSSLWYGFTDNSQVEMSIIPLSISNTVNMKILNIDGRQFGKINIEDNEKPSIEVQYGENDSAPNAKTGLEYKIFDVVVKDNLCDGKLLKTTTEVFYGNEKQEIENNAFTPVTEGFYTIRYTVNDAYGNTAVKEVEVEAKSDISSVDIILDEQWQSEIKYGEIVSIPQYHGVGGSGAYSYFVDIEVEGTKVENDKSTFIPLEVGKYLITLSVVDYLGQTKSVVKEYDVVFSVNFFIDEDMILMPPAFIDGNPFVFAEYSAYYYESDCGEKKTITAKIEVTDANGVAVIGADNKYIPKRSDAINKATVKIIFEKTINNVFIRKVIENEVPIRLIEKKGGFVADYFMLENSTISVKNQFITLESIDGTKDVKATFIRAVQAEEFAIQFMASSLNGVFRSNFSAIKVLLTDKNNKNLQVELKVKKNGNGLLFYINGENGIAMPGSLTEATTQNIVISYFNDSFILTGIENYLLGKINTDLSGKSFNGFTSNEVYVTITLDGVTDACAVNIVSINNQKLLNTSRDTAVPQVFIYGPYAGMFIKGSTIVMPTAKAYDVLNYTENAKIKITAPNGTIAKSVDGILLDGVDANKEYSVMFTQLGYYRINYYSTDLSGQIREITKDILIYDDVEPTVRLNSDLPERVWVGTEVKLPTYTVSDNGDVNQVDVTLLYVAPDGVMREIENKTILTDAAGDYVVYFYLIDANGTYNVTTYGFKAVAKN